MTSEQEEQAEKLRVTLQDADLRRQQQQAQATSFHKLAQADVDMQPHDRFHQVTAARVVGSTSSPAALYPAASAAHQTELPPEPPTGIDINALPELEPSMVTSVTSRSVEAQVTGALERDASSSVVPPVDDVERGPGAPSSFDGSASSQETSAFPTPGSPVEPSTSHQVDDDNG
jgi:hypothetical protein